LNTPHIIDQFLEIKYTRCRLHDGINLLRRICKNTIEFEHHIKLK